jgi:hypothetical protein
VNRKWSLRTTDRKNVGGRSSASMTTVLTRKVVDS